MIIFFYKIKFGNYFIKLALFANMTENDACDFFE